MSHAHCKILLVNIKARTERSERKGKERKRRKWSDVVGEGIELIIVKVMNSKRSKHLSAFSARIMQAFLLRITYSDHLSNNFEFRFQHEQRINGQRSSFQSVL